MATTAQTMHASEMQARRNSVQIYWKEAKYEFLRSLRLRAYSLSVMGFPVMFYTLFGLLMNRQDTIAGWHAATYLLASYGTFGVMGASLFGTAGALAAERGLGWLQVKRASPMPPGAYFFAKIFKSILFSAAVVLILLTLGVAFGGVRMPVGEAISLVLTLVAGSLPFCAMGLALGFFLGPNSAPAIINMIYLPFSFCSGLWIPFMFLPHFVQKIAVFLPPYHLAQLALDAVGAGDHSSAAIHWEVLIGFTLICLGIGRIGERHTEGKSYS
jgi:ABC-2 type transport system permease protein